MHFICKGQNSTTKYGLSNQSINNYEVSLFAAPSSFPLEVRGEGKSSSSLSIKWKPLPLLKQNGPGLYYVVYYRRADGKGRPFRKEIRNSSSYVVTGLNFYTKYEIRLQAANVKGFGPKSPPVFGYSGEKGREFKV